MNFKNILFATLFIINTAYAGKTVDSNEVLGMLDEIPGGKELITDHYTVNKTATGLMLGKQWQHLSGVVVSPFEIKLTSKKDPAKVYQLTVMTDLVFLDLKGEVISTNPKLGEQARGLRQVVKSIQITVPSPTTEHLPPKDKAEWNQWVEKQMQSDDGHGHGPDIGGTEWAYSISYRLKLSDKIKPLSKEWMERVNEALASRKASKNKE